jgi:hypothetical protein
LAFERGENGGAAAAKSTVVDEIHNVSDELEQVALGR